MKLNYLLVLATMAFSACAVAAVHIGKLEFDKDQACAKKCRPQLHNPRASSCVCTENYAGE